MTIAMRDTPTGPNAAARDGLKLAAAAGEADLTSVYARLADALATRRTPEPRRKRPAR